MTSLKKTHLIFLVVAVVLIAIFYFMDYSFLDKKLGLPTPTVGKTENFSTYYDSHQANPTMVPIYCIIIVVLIGIIASLR